MFLHLPFASLAIIATCETLCHHFGTCRLKEIRPFISTLHENYKETRKSATTKRSQNMDIGNIEVVSDGGSEEERVPTGEGMAADLLRRSGRDLSKADPSETRLLRDAMAELRSCWAGKEPLGPWVLQRDAGIRSYLSFRNLH